jgi:F-type H+-transporting ATPase subunit b
MEILAKLGIDWRLFTAQIINFAILLWVLRRFAYRPMLAFLEDRANRIEKGLQDADEARKKLTEAGEKEKEILSQAKEEARDLLLQAENRAKKHHEETLQKALQDAAKVVERTRLQMEAEKAQLLTDAKRELAELVLLTTEKVLQEKLTENKDKEFIQKHLAQN